MISGGNATLYVSNMDNSIRFYTAVLGLTLTNRFGNHWATVQAGTTLVIGLHPWAPQYPKPGTRGSVQLGLVVSASETIEEFAARLRTHNVALEGVVRSKEANYVFFTDPDGNPIYVSDWDTTLTDGDAVDQAVGAATK
jgi:catechol-2,3-dioxygenase